MLGGSGVDESDLFDGVVIVGVVVDADDENIENIDENDENIDENDDNIDENDDNRDKNDDNVDENDDNNNEQIEKEEKLAENEENSSETLVNINETDKTTENNDKTTEKTDKSYKTPLKQQGLGALRAKFPVLAELEGAAPPCAVHRFYLLNCDENVVNEEENNVFSKFTSN